MTSIPEIKIRNPIYKPPGAGAENRSTVTSGSADTGRKKANGYLLFMFKKKKESQLLQNVKIEQCMQMFDSEWNNLSEEEKTMWKNKAKKMNSKEMSSNVASTNDATFADRVYKIPNPPDWLNKTGKLLNRRGVNLNLEERRRNELRNVILPDLKKKKGSLADVKFVVIDMNIYQVPHLLSRFPGEIGIVVCSLKEGISFEYSALIDPRTTTMKQSAEAKVLEKELGLPPPFFEDSYDKYPMLENYSTQEYVDVLQTLYNVLNQTNNHLKPTKLMCFAVKDRICLLDHVLNWLMQSVNGFFDIVIFPLEELMTGLHEMSPSPQEHFSTHRLTSQDSKMRLMAELSCKWHKQKQFESIVDKCSLHVVKSQAYHFIQGLVKDYGMAITRGIQCPVEINKPVTKFITVEEDHYIGEHRPQKSQISKTIQAEMPSKEPEKIIQVEYIGLTPISQQRTKLLNGNVLRKVNEDLIDDDKDSLESSPRDKIKVTAQILLNKKLKSRELRLKRSLNNLMGSTVI